MAGEWIAVEHALGEKTEVLEMVAELEITTAAVVGGLIAVWAWFDRHSRDGRVTVQRLTCAHIDMLDSAACCKGFTAAMEKVGWMSNGDGFMAIPDWGKHFSKSAKDRLLHSRRQATYRRRKGDGAVGAAVGAPASRARLPQETEQETSNTTPPNPPLEGGELAFDLTTRAGRRAAKAAADSQAAAEYLREHGIEVPP